MATIDTVELTRQTVDIDMDGRVVVLCPHCSRMHVTVDDQGKRLRLPEECVRCECPMDVMEARKFSEAAARGEHIPQLAALGKAVRASQAREMADLEA